MMPRKWPATKALESGMGHGDGFNRSSHRQSLTFTPLTGSQASFKAPAFREIARRLNDLATYDCATITLEGESGTGKTFLAHEMHRASPRRDAPFVEVDLGSIEESLAGSELFGHVPGAFTGALSTRKGLIASAHTGTLFLDEIGKASLAIQRRLLTLLERRVVRPVGADREIPVDVRFFVATNVSLETLETQGHMLADLVPRLSAFRVKVPPLRERTEDIAALADACVLKHYRHYRFACPPAISEDLFEAMRCAPWHHNIRELDNVIQRLLVAGRSCDVLGLEHCHGQDLIFLRRLAHSGDHELPLSPQRAADAVRIAGSISQAARDLGVARSTVQRQVKRAR